MNADVIKPYVSNLVHTTDFWINLGQNSDKKDSKHNTEGIIKMRHYMLVIFKSLKTFMIG
jgi:hypothetical protein